MNTRRQGRSAPPRGPRTVRGTQPIPQVLITRIGAAELVTRPLAVSDAPAVQAMHERCSADTLRLRYLGPFPKMSERMIAFFADPARGRSLVTTYQGEVVAMTNVMNTGEPGVAEMAFLIEDPWQGQGLGGILLRHVIAMAPVWKLDELTASMYATNRRMLALMRRSGALLPTRFSAVIEVRLPLTGVTADTVARDTVARDTVGRDTVTRDTVARDTLVHR